MSEVRLNHPPQSSKFIEERLQPWIDRGECVIVITLGIMAWAAGWVDLIAFESPANPVVFGRYSLPFFGVLAVYTLGFGFWFWLIGSIRAIDGMKQLIGFVQRQPWLYARFFDEADGCVSAE